jgi:aspartyl-tRNA(Asn)/glutamyl-tRNA(Gln) amidotransferase subunit A
VSATDLTALSALELLDRYRAKQVSPVEVAQATLRRIEQLNPRLNAFCLLDPDTTLAQARAAEARWQRGAPMGRLDGVPVSIKDIIYTRGWPTLRGSQTIDRAGPWEHDAPATARLREHGAVFLGKTTTPEFGWKAVTDSPLTGITRNPWNPAKTTGGSSGGAAAAVATGMGPLAVGTDGGGSIRMPCGFTGVFGLKPSFGRVPAWPLSPFGTVAHLGPMTRTVSDAALMLNVLALPDARDWYALPYDARDYLAGIDEGVRGLRIAFSLDLGYVTVDAEVAAHVTAAAKRFEQLGARVEAVDPGFDNPLALFNMHWFAGAAFLASGFSVEQRKRLDPGLQEVIAAGEQISRQALQEAAHLRGELGVCMQLFHQKYDLLLTPTLPIPAFDAGQEVPDPRAQKRWTEWTPFSYPFNLTQQPAASIPCGLTTAGLPVGLQIVGPRYADALVLRAARAIETLLPRRMPDLSALA